MEPSGVDGSSGDVGRADVDTSAKVVGTLDSPTVGTGLAVIAGRSLVGSVLGTGVVPAGKALLTAGGSGL